MSSRNIEDARLDLCHTPSLFYKVPFFRKVISLERLYSYLSVPYLTYEDKCNYNIGYDFR